MSSPPVLRNHRGSTLSNKENSAPPRKSCHTRASARRPMDEKAHAQLAEVIFRFVAQLPHPAGLAPDAVVIVDRAANGSNRRATRIHHSPSRATHNPCS